MSNFRSSNRVKLLCLFLFVSFVCATYGIVNVISSRYFLRKSFGRKPGITLSVESLKLLNSLKSDVEIFILLERNREYAATFDRIGKDLRRVMNEFVRSSNERKFRVEIVDIAENSKRYADLCARFGILPANCVVIAANGKVKVLSIDEFYKTRDGYLIAFRGEQVVSAVLRELTCEGDRVVYFAVGHGEFDTDGTSPSQGLSVLKHIITQKNCSVQCLDLCASKSVPEDASLVVIAGAKNKFFALETEVLRDFINNRNGKLVVALDGNFDAGLDDFFRDYGIVVGEDLLVPSNGRATNYSEDLIIKRFAPHKINDRIIEFRVPVILGATREVSMAPRFADAEKFEITELLQADSVTVERKNAKDAESESRVVATISERKKFDATGVTASAGKVLVIGNADFISNEKFKSLGNRIFWAGISDYMIYGENTGEFRDVAAESYKLTLSKMELGHIVLRVSFLPIGFLLLALVVAFKRRK